MNVITALLLSMLLLFSGCQTANSIASSLTDSLKMEYYQVHGYDGLTSHYIRENDLDNARLYAEKIYYPIQRANAFISIANMELCLEGDSRAETLDKVTEELDLLYSSSGKVCRLASFLDLLCKIDPEHVRPEITDRINLIFSDFNSTVKEFSEEGQISNGLMWAKKKFFINADDCLNEVREIDKKILQIKSASDKSPFLIDRVSFEIEVTQDIPSAKDWINSAQKTIAMIANAKRREDLENKLMQILDKNSFLFCD